MSMIKQKHVILFLVGGLVFFSFSSGWATTSRTYPSHSMKQTPSDAPSPSPAIVRPLPRTSLDPQLFSKKNYQAPEIDTSTWQKIYYTYRGMTFRLSIPPEWGSSTTVDPYDKMLAYLKVGPITEAESTKGFYFGSGIIFSTSGQICGNANCSTVGTISVPIDGKVFESDIVLNHQDHHRFVLGFFNDEQKNISISITADFANEDELLLMLASISTVKRVKLSPKL